MRIIKQFMDEQYAKSAARLMELICYFVIFFFIVGLMLSFMGRQTFILYTSDEIYNSAIYSEKSHEWTSRGPTISIKDEVRVRAYNGDKVDLGTQIGLSTMYAINVVPLTMGFWFLSRVFKNVSRGQIFTDENAGYLLYYGLIQMAVAAFVPFIKLFIVFLTNHFTRSELSIATGQNLLNDLIPNIAFIVAAYIIHYGIYLQDEVEHTL